MVRILIELKTKKIPLNYNYLILSLIKSVLSRENPTLFKMMYEDEEIQFRTKPFTFALKLEDFNIEKEEVLLKERVVLTVSTNDYVFGSVIYNSFINTRTFQYQNLYDIKIGKVNVLKERNINSTEAVFKTLSPLVIKNKEGKFISITDEDYENELNYIANEVLKSSRGIGLKENLKFEPVLMKKRVVKEKISKVTKRTSKDIFYITGTEGIFKLTGDKEDLNLIYKMGLGFRRSSGFGCLEIV